MKGTRSNRTSLLFQAESLLNWNLTGVNLLKFIAVKDTKNVGLRYSDTYLGGMNLLYVIVLLKSLFYAIKVDSLKSCRQSDISRNH